VGLANVWLYEPHGEVDPNEAQICRIPHDLQGLRGDLVAGGPLEEHATRALDWAYHKSEEGPGHTGEPGLSPPSMFRFSRPNSFPSSEVIYEKQAASM